MIEFPKNAIRPSLAVDTIALAERDIHGAAADLMLAVQDMNLNEVLAVSKKLISLRAALDTASDFVLARAEELTK